MACAFLDAMSNDSITKLGVNGSCVYTEKGMGHALVPLFTMLVRDGEQGMANSLSTIMNNDDDRSQYMVDLFVMAFQTRDVRGGKGERDLFIKMLLELLKYYPDAIESVFHLVPTYGRWKDMWQLWTAAGLYRGSEWVARVRKAIDTVVCDQFRMDWTTLDRFDEQAKISLLAKWMPREGGSHDYLSVHYAQLLFPSTEYIDDKRCAYRKACSVMNAHLKTAEVNMCEQAWSAIEPSTLPGRCMNKNKRALLNLVPAHMHIKGHTTIRGRRITGKLINVIDDYHSNHSKHNNNKLRYPMNEDRMLCRSNFIEFNEQVKDGKVAAKGADVIMPHEIVKQFIEGKGLAKEVIDVLEGQWAAIRDAFKFAGGLKGIVPMADFSGSMAGIPIQVAMAIGILISEVNCDSFKDHMMTFDEIPEWISFKGIKTLHEKIALAESAPWGASTNFQGACDLILMRLIQGKVPDNAAPKDLLVLTDMGFDAALGSAHWQTHVQIIRKSFECNGYTAPRIIIWNLRAEYKDFHATAHEDGVVMLSGWSPAALKAIQHGGIEVRTSYDGMRILLDAERYDAVREALKGI